MRQEKMSKYDRSNFPLRVLITNMEDKVPIHTHDFIEIVFFSKGNATHSIHHGDKTLRYSVMQGDCFSILPHEEHSFEDGNQARYYNIIFSPSLVLNELEELKEFDTWFKLFGNKEFDERTKFHLGLNDRAMVDMYLQRLMYEFEKREKGYKLCAKYLLMEILLIILRCNPTKMFTSVSSAKSNFSIMQIINEMEKYPEKHCTLDDMAKKANMCVSGFTKKFRNMVGISPSEYLLLLRAEKAKHLILTTTVTMYDIAEKCGFYDINYFIKVFKRFYGVTPAKFRKENK